MLKVGIVGVAGRMGQALVAEVLRRGGMAVAAGADVPDHPLQGTPIRNPETGDALDVIIGDDPKAVFDAADVVIDFTLPTAMESHLVLAASTETPIVIGTTGLEENHHQLIDEVSKQVPLVQSANMSLGVNLLSQLVRQAAEMLDTDWDIEVVEMHHRHKVDAPSGTALLLGDAAATGRGLSGREDFVLSREGITGEREAGTIGFATLRGGDVAGEHSVVFAADAERVELTHKATDRRIFARGAVTAAQWVKGLPPGRYDMLDVLGLS